jgi:hypothetical protein
VQVVVGVLLKYVRLGTGWRTRLFVLDGGVLQYYKVGAERGWCRGEGYCILCVCTASCAEQLSAAILQVGCGGILQGGLHAEA